ncbi:sulfotransferase family 2 domain-containing protein [Alcanivorax sp.]|jgi:hypothetical protein|uniref:sulfotransferase family 2 domain-containing protein n=1 Tax=Alcanivorax sp. TaxID=1872427 RepID=UPI0032D8C903
MKRDFERKLPLYMSGLIKTCAPSKNPFTDACRNKETIFIHVPKNAGRSIYRSVFNEPGRHIQLKRYYIYDRCRASRYYKFAVVRDPVDRFVSAFNGLKGSGIGNGEYDKFVNENIDHFQDVSDFVDWMALSKCNVNKVLGWLHFYPQYKWISVVGDEIAVDRVLKFEFLQDDWPSFAKERGFSEKLSFVGKGVANYQSLSDFQIKFIRRVYSKDCQLFSY